MSLVLFSISWVGIIYSFNCFLQKKLLIPDVKMMSLYIATVTLIGAFGEVFLSTVYTFIVGHPLWVYHFLPIHHAYTSYYSFFMWGLYGFHLYLLHGHLKNNKIFSDKTLALIISCEAVFLEVVYNLSFLVLFNQYIFYYASPDLWHLSSLQAVPLYFLAGLVIVKTLRRFSQDPRFFTIMSYLFVIVFIFFS